MKINFNDFGWDVPESETANVIAFLDKIANFRSPASVHPTMEVVFEKTLKLPEDRGDIEFEVALGKEEDIQYIELSMNNSTLWSENVLETLVVQLGDSDSRPYDYDSFSFANEREIYNDHSIFSYRFGGNVSKNSKMRIIYGDTKRENRLVSYEAPVDIHLYRDLTIRLVKGGKRFPGVAKCVAKYIVENNHGKIKAGQYWNCGEKDRPLRVGQNIFFRTLDADVRFSNMQAAGQIPVRKGSQISYLELRSKKHTSDSLMSLGVSINVQGLHRFSMDKLCEAGPHHITYDLTGIETKDCSGTLSGLLLGAGQSFNVRVDVPENDPMIGESLEICLHAYVT